MKDDERKITCPECGEVNSVDFPEYSGTFTKFCQGCGTALRLHADRNLREIGLKKNEKNLK